MFPWDAITATASRLPQMEEFRGDFLYFLPFLAKAGLEHSSPFVAGQQRKSILTALEPPS